MKSSVSRTARGTRWTLGAAIGSLVLVAALPSGWQSSHPPAAASPPPATDAPHPPLFAAAAPAASSLSAAGGTPSPADNPLAPRDRGCATIAALQEAGRFDTAADYAIADSGAFRRDLIIAAFHAWGRRQSDTAVSAALRVSDPPARRLALASALSGWARTDPAGLAESALAFPDGPEKHTALTKALRAWLVADPDHAGDWIAAHPETLAVAEKMIRDDRR